MAHTRTTLSEYSSILSLALAVVYVVRDLLPDEQRTFLGRALKALPPGILLVAMLFFLALGVLGGLRRLRRLETEEANRDTQLASYAIEVGALRDAVGALRGKMESRAPNELEWRGVVWRWDGTEVTGPFCPEHNAHLGYQHSSGLRVEFANFDDNWWVGASGRLICPIDNATFENTSHEKVSGARDAVEDRFRAIYKLPPKPPRPLTQAEIEMRDRAAESLRRAMQGFGLGGPPKS